MARGPRARAGEAAGGEASRLKSQAVPREECSTGEAGEGDPRRYRRPGTSLVPGGLRLYMWLKFLWFIKVQSCSVLGADAQTPLPLHCFTVRQECLL